MGFFRTWSRTDNVWKGTKHLTHLTAINRSLAVVSCKLSHVGVSGSGSGGVAAVGANEKRGGGGGGGGNVKAVEVLQAIEAVEVAAFAHRSWVRSAKSESKFWCAVIAGNCPKKSGEGARIPDILPPPLPLLALEPGDEALPPDEESFTAAEVEMTGEVAEGGQEAAEEVVKLGSEVMGKRWYEAAAAAAAAAAGNKNGGIFGRSSPKWWEWWGGRWGWGSGRCESPWWWWRLWWWWWSPRLEDKLVLLLLWLLLLLLASELVPSFCNFGLRGPRSCCTATSLRATVVKVLNMDPLDMNYDLPSLFMAESKHFLSLQALHWFLCVLSMGQRPLKSPWALQVYTRPLWILRLKNPEQPKKVKL